jgi:hypothetical protein
VLHRARSRLGEQGHCLLRNNCEHVSHWCVDGVARSEQVERLLLRPSACCARIKRRLLSKWTGPARGAATSSLRVHVGSASGT